MNKAFLIGNLANEPELRYSSGNRRVAICRFVVIHNDRRKNPQTNEFEQKPVRVQIVTFGRQAENCDRFLSKGHKVAIVGRLQISSFEKDGVKNWTSEIIARQVEFLGGGSGQTQPRDTVREEAPADTQGHDTSFPSDFSLFNDDDDVPY